MGEGVSRSRLTDSLTVELNGKAVIIENEVVGSSFESDRDMTKDGQPHPKE